MDSGEVAGVTLAVIVSVAVVAYVAYAGLTSGTSTVQPTGPSPTASNCSGYPPGGNCLAPYSYTFTIQVAYQGGWNLTYRGTTDVGEPTQHEVDGTRVGTGNFSLLVSLSGLNDQELILCATAGKLDGSNATLVLTLSNSVQTSAPRGTASTCAAVAP